MRLDEGLDTGPMLLRREVPIGRSETAEDLYPKLSEIGAELLVQTLIGLQAGSITPQIQDESLASLAPILGREDGAIDFSRSAKEVYDRWRGFQPWPGAWTTVAGRKLLVSKMLPAHVSSRTELGGQLHIEQGRIFASCADGTWISLDEVQLEGKKRMPAEDFLRGFPLKSGDRLGQ